MVTPVPGVSSTIRPRPQEPRSSSPCTDRRLMDCLEPAAFGLPGKIREPELPLDRRSAVFASARQIRPRRPTVIGKAVRVRPHVFPWSDPTVTALAGSGS